MGGRSHSFKFQLFPPTEAIELQTIFFKFKTAFLRYSSAESKQGGYDHVSPALLVSTFFLLGYFIVRLTNPTLSFLKVWLGTESTVEALCVNFAMNRFSQWPRELLIIRFWGDLQAFDPFIWSVPPKHKSSKPKSF